MDGFLLAKDGERAGANPDQSGTGAPSRAPSQGSRLFPFPDAAPRPIESPTWIHDHESVNLWLRSIPADDRPRFLARIASNIESIQKSPFSRLEPGCEDSNLSYAILIEYAEHLGVSPLDACWTFERDDAEPIDALLGARVDKMLAEAASRRSRPRRRGEDADAPPPPEQGVSEHWKATPSRRLKDRGGEELSRRNWTRTDTLAFHAAGPGRAG